ncbi:MAG: AsmA-like C-terminal region-containing protein, partial [Bacteroidota bacterium]
DFHSIQNVNRHEVDFAVESDLNLTELGRRLAFSPDMELKGSIEGEISGSGIIDDRAGIVQPAGQEFMSTIRIDDLRYLTSNLSVSIQRGNLSGDEQKVDLKLEDVAYDDAIDFDLIAVVEQPLSYLFDSNHQLTAEVDFDGGIINMNQLASEDTSDVQRFYPIPPHQIDADISIASVIQGEYTYKDITAIGKISKESQIEFVIGDFMGSRFEGAGNLTDVMEYGLNGGTLSGQLDVRSNRLDLNRFMGANETGQGNIGDPSTLIPSNLDIKIDYSSDQIGFKNIDILQSLGNISIENGVVQFDSRGNLFGGLMKASGTFRSRGKQGYRIGLELGLEELGFQQTASTMKLFTQLLPVAKFIEGEYTASLAWASDLSPNYMPDLNSITARGDIRTKEGRIDGLLPIDSFIARFGGIRKRLDPIQLSNRKGKFEIEDGKIRVENIQFETGDVLVQLSGLYGFDQSVDYDVIIDIPQTANTVKGVLDFIQDKTKFSNRLRSLGDEASLQVEAKMIGSTTNPRFEVSRVSLKTGDQVESIEDIAVNAYENFRDSLRTVIDDTLSQIGSEVSEGIDSLRSTVDTTVDSLRSEVATAVDSTRQVLDQEVDSLKSQAVNTGEQILTDLSTGNVDSVGTRLDDLLKGGGKGLDSLKSKVRLPFFGGGKNK